MRTPYPAPTADLRAMALLLHQWTSANKRAREAYYAHPFCDEYRVTEERQRAKAEGSAA